MHEQRMQLVEQLSKSYALETLWPDVFAHGKAKVRFVTNGYGRNGVCKVRNGAGEERTFSIDDVPDIMKPKELLNAVRQRLPR